MSPSTVLYRNGRVYSPAAPGATALLVVGDRVAWVGADADALPADREVDLDGAVVTPAFVDAHVHATDTGLALAGLDLSGARSAAQVCAAVARHADGLPADAVVLGHGWDESTWPAGQRTPPDAGELQRAGGGRRVYLSQASLHSCLVSAAMLAAAPEAAAATGYDGSGWLRRDAHHVVRALAFGQITTAQRASAQRVALRRAASLGIAAVHECGGRGTSSEADFTHLLSLSGAAESDGREFVGSGVRGLPQVFGYWGELMAAAKARELGAVGAGGDLYADGALGSQTAHLTQDYVGGGCGHAYLTAEQVRDHLVDCAAHDMQGGFHAIGDAAIGTVLAGFAAAADRLGVERLRAAGHRVEHAEIMSKRLIAGFVEYGIVASMQPAFDRLWGGTEQMYAQRLGVARALESNPMGAMHAVGVSLAFGSDSPVTPMDPWGSVRAAVRHHNPVQRMSVKSAFAAHTRGGWRAAGGSALIADGSGPSGTSAGPAGSTRSAAPGSAPTAGPASGRRVSGGGASARGREQAGHGVLVPGAPATFAVWHAPDGLAGGLPALMPAGHDEPEPALPTCLRTVLRGRVIFERS